jgi:hypothetical protein
MREWKQWTWNWSSDGLSDVYFAPDSFKKKLFVSKLVQKWVFLVRVNAKFSSHLEFIITLKNPCRSQLVAVSKKCMLVPILSDLCRGNVSLFIPLSALKHAKETFHKAVKRRSLILTRCVLWAGMGHLGYRASISGKGRNFSSPTDPGQL